MHPAASWHGQVAVGGGGHATGAAVITDGWGGAEVWVVLGTVVPTALLLCILPLALTSLH